MKRLKSYMITNGGEGDCISYMYNEIDDNTGEIISKNNRGSFYPVDDKGKRLVENMKKYIYAEKLQG
ncbi:MAG: hypothetical protein K1W34_14220 [Lachnospiraceae bacterium]